MRNKILFTVMALLLTATGRVWAQAEDEETAPTATAYAVYCEGDNSLHFLCSSETLGEGDTFQNDKNETLTITNVWSETAVTATEDRDPKWYDQSKSIKKVVFEKSFAAATPQSCYCWFSGFTNLTTIEGLEYLNTSEVTDMYGMFTNCSSLTSITFGENFDTSEVKDMGNMFRNCSGLTSITFGENFKASSVTDMYCMFAGCNSLTELNLSSFDTSMVRDMDCMFSYCSGLTSLTFGEGFSTSSVIDMGDMFYNCNNLKLLDLSKVTSPITKFSTLVSMTPEKTMIYVSEGTTVPGDRTYVVVSDEGKNLVIGSSQVRLYIHEDFTASKITIARTFTAGNPHTLYLPFAMDATKYGTFYTCTGYDDDGTVTFSAIEENEENVTATTANTPYLFIPNADGINADGTIVIEPEQDSEGITVVANTAVMTSAEPTEGYGLIGVYEKKTFTADEASEGIYYGWAGGEFKRAGEGASVDACRAYLKLPSTATANSAPASLRVKFSGTTGINNTAIKADSRSDAPAYNLQGQRVGSSYRGLVIKNGKKVMNK